MYETFKRLADQALFAAQYADPYVQSHPMPCERVATLERMAKGSPNWDKRDPPEMQLRHDLMRAKLSGFLDRPDTIARRYPSPTPACPRAMPARSRPIAQATCATPSCRSTV